MKRLFASAALLLLILSLSMPAFSQGSFAAVTGSIADSSGGLIPGVTVTATAVDTGVVTTAVTNETGSYNFPALAPGNYKLSASLPGFQTQNITDVRLGAAQSYRYNFKLTVSGVNTQIDVSISAQTILSTSGATIGQVMTQQKVQDLPMVGNNVLDLITTLAGADGVINNIGFGASNAFGREGTTFAGVSAQNIATVRDGIIVSDTRYPTGINSATVINPDLVGEIRLILAPVDAEIGRGNGTIQIQTRSGTNRYSGAAVWAVQNTKLNPNTWLNNRNQTLALTQPPGSTPIATQPNWQNQNQVTLSFGGPVVKNKTFFYALFDFNDERQRSLTNFTVLTPCARNGVMRYFDTWNNGNVTTTAVATGTTPITPVVNFDGSPKAPATSPTGGAQNATLRYLSVFGPLTTAPTKADCSDAVNGTTLAPVGAASSWDPYRKTLDPTGFITRNNGYMPLPNNYETGDGLNTAGFRWLRHNRGLDNLFGVGESTGDRRQINVKVDQNFSSKHKANVNVSYEHTSSDDVFQGWPDTFSNENFRRPLVVTSAFTSTLSAGLLNEARFGLRRTGVNVVAPWDRDVPEYQEKLAALLPPKVNGFLVLPSISGGFAFCYPYTGARPPGGCAPNAALTSTARDISPTWTYADNLSWTAGSHALKFGAEIRLNSSASRLSSQPFFSAVKAPAQAIGGTIAASAPQANGATSLSSGNPAFTTLGITNGTNARNLLNYLSGSLSQISHQYFLTDPTKLDKFSDYRDSALLTTKLKQTEMTFFAKDDYKLSKSLTLNLGVRWENYAVPYVASGLTVSPIGGGGAGFGISGRDFTGWMRPGKRADLTNMEFVGPNSPNPGKSVYPNDYNNFGPAIGFAWTVPYFGEGKTTVRGGYQITYQGGGRFNTLEPVLSLPPGSTYPGVYDGSSNNDLYLDLTDLGAALPAPVPVKPMQAIPLTDRNPGNTFSVFDANYTTPYVQNLTLSVTRSMSRSVTLDVRYVGTLAKKQYSTLNLNTNNFLYNGLLDEFNKVRSGGESAMLDSMMNGINLCAATTCTAPTVGATFGVIGSTIAGVKQTAAYQMRSSSTFNLNLANGQYSAIAGSLNTLNPAGTTGVRGQILRSSGLFPENFITANPQVGTVTQYANNNSNNYHSLQVETSVRPTHGVSGQVTYSWSKNLGLGAITNPVDRALDYTNIGNNRTHQLRTNGTIELPFGPNKLMFGNSSGVLARAIERWQLGLIFNLSSGAPTSITATSMLYGNGLPDIVRPVDFNKLAGMRWDIRPTGSNFTEGRFFDNNDVFVKVPDPQCYAVSSAQNLNGLAPATGAPALRCTLTALAMVVPAGTADTVALTDGTGRVAQIVLQHPQPGKRGNLGANTVMGMGTWRFDANLQKSFRISESKAMTVRVDTLNVLNHPEPAAPSITLNGATTPFGQSATKGGGRIFQGTLRLTF